jgi:hypothetical protein
MNASTAPAREARSAIPPGHRQVAASVRDASSRSAAAWPRRSPLRPSQVPIEGPRASSPGGLLAVSEGPALVQRCGGHACPPSGCHRDRDGQVAPSRIGPGRSALAPASVRDVVAEPGASLPSAVRADAEYRFGHSFGSVRIHTDSSAARSAAAIAARAYTFGSHIAFAAGEYRPETRAGRQLLAHELTHVVQQRGAAGATAQQRSSATVASAAETSDSPLVLGDPGDALENEADSIAEQMLRDRPSFAASPPAIAGYPPTRAAPLVHRSPDGSPGHDVIQRQAGTADTPAPAQAAPPAAGPPTAGPDVFFCSKPVALGRKHAFFRVGGAGPGNPTYELEHDNFGDHCPCGIQGIPCKDYGEDKDSAEATCVPAPAISAACLELKYDTYPHGYYCATPGPNSNTYARVTAEACGGTGLKPPGNLPGWDHLPPAAGTANPTKNVHWDVIWCNSPKNCQDTSCK